MATGAKRGKARAANPLKTPGRSKARVRALADRARPRRGRRHAYETVTGQGGSTRRPRGAADSRHPSQHGGVRAANLRDTPAKARAAERRRASRVKSGGPAKGPSRSRAGAVGVGGRTRTGRDRSGRRGRARNGSRARGRAPSR